MNTAVNKTEYKYRLDIEYDGGDFYGWQHQDDAKTVQGVLEAAIFRRTNEQTRLYVAGRTDSGVHALGQVAHFSLRKNFDPYRLTASINHFVRPHKVVVKACTRVGANFHARFDAKKRYYRYQILNTPYLSVLEEKRSCRIKLPLDEVAMQNAANHLVGLHDFTTFRAADCQANSPLRTIDIIKVQRNGSFIYIDVAAQSFLYHMVRNIAGSLINVGISKWQPDYIKKILEAKDRKSGGPTAPAHGLYFVKVDY